jgi:hypothetical protein
MKIRQLKSALAVMLIVATTSLFAGDIDRRGTAAATQLLIPVGGKNFAMSGANTASTKGIDALYWNPAGLGLVTGGEAMFSTMNYFGDEITINYLAGAYNVGFGVVGVSFKAFDFGDIPLTTNDDPLGLSGATFSPTFAILGFSFAKKFTDAISFGLNLKYITEEVPSASAEALAFDFGLQYRNLGNIKNLDFGVVANNIGQDMTFEGSAFLHEGSLEGSIIPDYFYAIPIQTFELPTSYSLGLAYTYNIDNDNQVKVAGTFVSENLDADRMLLGAEYGLMSIFYARLGYQMQPGNTNSDQDVFGLTAGIGVDYSFSGVKASLNYVYRDQQFFDANNLFSFSVQF